MIRFIVGLRNPGTQYAATRHNAGAWFIDEFAENNGLAFKIEKKFHLELAEFSWQAQRIYLGKPLTYMNESGIAVAAFAKFYQIQPEEILVVHDELDFAPGIVRLKKDGSHGGHNGLKDIFARMGSTDCYRLRIGIGHPGDRDKVVGYVLQNPPLAERVAIDQAIDRALEILPDIFVDHIASATQRLNSD